MKPLNDWTKKEFEQLPSIGWNQESEPFDSLVILPTKYTHDSGFKCMDFIAVQGDEPKFRISGGSDVIHINGICGLGEDWLNKYGAYPTLIPPISWSIDCLKTSKLLRLFSRKKLKAGVALSSFEIFAIDEIKPEKQPA